MTFEEYKNLINSRKSFVKYTYPPSVPNRDKFPLPRKHEYDYDFLHPFQKLGLLSFLRYVFPRWTIRPDGRYMQRYEWFRAICAMMSAFVFPCYMYMSLQFPFVHSMAIFLDYCAYFDLLQRMLVAFYNEKGILVYHPASTAAHYIKGAFIVDLLGLLPLEILDMGRSKMYKHPTKDMYIVSKISQYLACNRLLQLYRLPSAFNTLSAYIEREDILLIVKGMPLLMGLLNVMTMSMLEESIIIYKPEEGAGWLFLKFTDDGSQWLEKANESSMMLTTYYSVRVISIRANVNQALAGFQEHIRDITDFMKQEKVSAELHKEVIDYYTYSWDKMGGIDYSSMFKLCDQITLRTDAIMNIYGPTFNKVRTD
ncbi:uncharacterized protein LOC113232576 [Hyposmocoma kahamanoa]|uniref:uncharacterized protein LOC113232576 n=1 Tax=Hyposmocoma kahamanoa TaxID=1477025 RepID=UPI000E6D7370|nr:uncharacterized protein LOC113232576 [Hyposmocoma kahamanoa]